MATASDDVSDCFECVVCTEMYDDKTHIPKRLHCSHNVCVVCAWRLLKQGQIRCPICNTVTLVTDSGNLYTDIQTLKFTSAFKKCVDCCRLITDIRECSTCTTRSCEQCSLLHRSPDHCSVLQNLRGIKQGVNEQKINQALDIRAKFDRKIQSFEKLKSDVKSAFESRKRCVLEQIARMERDRQRLEDFISTKDLIQSGKSDLENDENIQRLKSLSGKSRNGVSDWDDIKVALSAGFNVQKMMEAISKISIDDGTEVKGQGVRAGVDYYRAKGRVKRQKHFPTARFLLHIATCSTTGFVYMSVELLQSRGSQIITIDPSHDWTRVGQIDVQGKVLGLTVISDQQIVAIQGEKDPCVHIYTRSGGVIRSFGSCGKLDALFEMPEGLVHHNGRLYITDCLNKSITVLTVEGEFCHQFTHESLRCPVELAVNKDGDIFVNNCEEKHIQVFTNDGRHKTTITKAGEYNLLSQHIIYVDRENNLLVAGRHDDKLIVDVFDASLTHQTRIHTDVKLEQNSIPKGLCVTVHGDIVIAIGQSEKLTTKNMPISVTQPPRMIVL